MWYVLFIQKFVEPWKHIPSFLVFLLACCFLMRNTVPTSDSQSSSNVLNSDHFKKNPKPKKPKSSSFSPSSSSLLKLYENDNTWKMSSKEEEEFSATGNCHQSFVLVVWRGMRKDREAFCVFVEQGEGSYVWALLKCKLPAASIFLLNIPILLSCSRGWWKTAFCIT